MVVVGEEGEPDNLSHSCGGGRAATSTPALACFSLAVTNWCALGAARAEGAAPAPAPAAAVAAAAAAGGAAHASAAKGGRLGFDGVVATMSVIVEEEEAGVGRRRRGKEGGGGGRRRV